MTLSFKKRHWVPAKFKGFSSWKTMEALRKGLSYGYPLVMYPKNDGENHHL